MVLEAAEVSKWVMGLVSSGTIVATECVVEAFSVTSRPDPICHLE